jgi:hypothetical protein
MRAVERVGEEIRKREEDVRMRGEDLKAREEKIREIVADIKEVVDVVRIRNCELKEREDERVELGAMRRQSDEQGELLRTAEMAGAAMRVCEMESGAVEEGRSAEAMAGQQRATSEAGETQFEDAETRARLIQNPIDSQKLAETRLEKQYEPQVQENSECDAEETARKAKEKENHLQREQEREDELRKERADPATATALSIQPRMATAGTAPSRGQSSGPSVSDGGQAMLENSNKLTNMKSSNDPTDTREGRSTVSSHKPFGSTSLAADKTSRNFTTNASQSLPPSLSTSLLHPVSDLEGPILEMEAEDVQEIDIGPTSLISPVAQATNLRHLTNAVGVNWNTYSTPIVTVKREPHEDALEPTGFRGFGNSRIGGVTVLPDFDSMSPTSLSTSHSQLRNSSTSSAVRRGQADSMTANHNEHHPADGHGARKRAKTGMSTGENQQTTGGVSIPRKRPREASWPPIDTV